MRKSHKKALGLLGLATVVGMTAVAANLPTPAGAVSSVTDVISVTVVDETTPAASIINIKDGTIFTDPIVDIDVDYVNLKNLTLKLKWGSSSTFSKSRTASGSETLRNDTFTYDQRTGKIELQIDLNNYGGYNTYSISVEGDGYNGGTAAPSSVSFRYTGASIEGIGTDTDSEGNIIDSDIPTDKETGDPIITPQTSSEVDYVDIEVFYPDGTLIFTEKGKDGEPSTLPFSKYNLPTGDYIIVITGRDSDGFMVGDPIRILYHYIAPQSSEANNGNPVINVPTVSGDHYIIIEVLDSDDNSVIPGGVRTDVGGDVTLPFTEYNVKTGTYTIVVTEYDGNGRVVRTYRFTLHYLPNPPKTGGLLGNLNISRADYLTTGLIVFGLALVFAFVFLRKKKSTKRR